MGLWQPKSQTGSHSQGASSLSDGGEGHSLTREKVGSEVAKGACMGVARKLGGSMEALNLD